MKTFKSYVEGIKDAVICISAAEKAKIEVLYIIKAENNCLTNEVR